MQACRVIEIDDPPAIAIGVPHEIVPSDVVVVDDELVQAVKTPQAVHDDFTEPESLH